MFTEETFLELREDAIPEIKRCNMCNVILQVGIILIIDENDECEQHLHFSIHRIAFKGCFEEIFWNIISYRSPRQGCMLLGIKIGWNH